MLIECPHEALKGWRRDLKKVVVDLARLDETKLQAKSCPVVHEAELGAMGSYDALHVYGYCSVTE